VGRARASLQIFHPARHLNLFEGRPAAAVALPVADEFFVRGIRMADSPRSSLRTSVRASGGDMIELKCTSTSVPSMPFQTKVSWGKVVVSFQDSLVVRK
jgi:hypothetical protein